MPSKKYSNKDFKKDLTQLKNLIKKYKGGNVESHDPYMSPWGSVSSANATATRSNLGVKKAPVGVVGGKPKRSVKRSSSKVERRSFTIVEVDNKKIPSGEGRYTIKANGNQTPANAASKACTRALSKRNKNKLVIKVRETTAGSEKKVKCYDCSRTKLKTPIKIDRGGKTQVITHKTHIKERMK